MRLPGRLASNRTLVWLQPSQLACKECRRVPQRLQVFAIGGAVDESSRRLLDTFWTVRGVHAVADREKLVDLATRCNFELNLEQPDANLQASQDANTHGGAFSEALPGMVTLWELQQGSEVSAAALEKVTIASRRLLQLSQILGSQDDIDVVFMVVREPNLMIADLDKITRRIFELRLALGGRVDVSRLVERQPSLLLDDSKISAENVEEALHSWMHGLPSDSSNDWAARIAELKAYRRAHGDVHVGYRESDEPQLKRWCQKQRHSHQKGLLTEEQIAVLRDVGFEFDDDEAEWQRWFTELKQFQLKTGHTDSSPFTAESEFYLTNWCSVQRIARRSSVLREERVKLLDALAFDWTGADPLS